MQLVANLIEILSFFLCKHYLPISAKSDIDLILFVFMPVKVIDVEIRIPHSLVVSLMSMEFQET